MSPSLITEPLTLKLKELSSDFLKSGVYILSATNFYVAVRFPLAGTILHPVSQLFCFNLLPGIFHIGVISPKFCHAMGTAQLPQAAHFLF